LESGSVAEANRLTGFPATYSPEAVATAGAPTKNKSNKYTVKRSNKSLNHDGFKHHKTHPFTPFKNSLELLELPRQLVVQGLPLMRGELA